MLYVRTRAIPDSRERKQCLLTALTAHIQEFAFTAGERSETEANEDQWRRHKRRRYDPVNKHIHMQRILSRHLRRYGSIVWQKKQKVSCLNLCRKVVHEHKLHKFITGFFLQKRFLLGYLSAKVVIIWSMGICSCSPNKSGVDSGRPFCKQTLHMCMSRVINLLNMKTKLQCACACARLVAYEGSMLMTTSIRGPIPIPVNRPNATM